MVAFILTQKVREGSLETEICQVPEKCQMLDSTTDNKTMIGTIKNLH